MSAGQYFEVKIDYVDISPEDFKMKLESLKNGLNILFNESRGLEKDINKNLSSIRYED